MDRYSITARVYPMVIFYLPLSVIFIFLAWDFEKYLHLGVPVSFLGLLTYLMAQMGRDSGKSKEPKLWDKWGGAPTTQLFRWRNDKIDNHTKQRNHRKMQDLCPTEVKVDKFYENENPKKADEVYKSWTRFLIGQTRDIKKYSLLFKENMAYGFRRNLWGLKTYAIILIVLLIIGTYFYFVYVLELFNPLVFPMIFWVSETFLFIFLLFWIFLVRKSWVSIPAYSYAERLHEAIGTL